MKNFTVSENATRKSVIEFVRKYSYKPQSEYKERFGSSKVVMAAIEEAKDRIRRNSPVQSIQEQFLAKLSANASSLSRCLPDSGFSMGETKRIVNRKFNVFGRFDNTREYAKSCAWSAKHGDVEMNLPVNLLGKLEAMEGVMTLRGKQIQQGIWKCEWLVLDFARNRRGFITSEISYHMEKGYVVRRESGRRFKEGWFHTADLSDARQHLKQFVADHKEELKWQAREAKLEAERNAAKEKQQKELAKAMKRVEKSPELIAALNHMYVYQDSIKAGNCIPGTNGFLTAHNLKKSDTRSGEFLLRISRGSWQHSNVVRIILNYIRNTYGEFFAKNEKALNIILNR